MKKIIILMCLSFWCYSNVEAINIEECQQLARNNYPMIKQFDLLELSKSYDLSNLAKNYLPDAEFYGQATWQNKVPKFPDSMNELYSKVGLSMGAIDKDQYKIGANVNQLIWDGGMTASQKKTTNAQSIVQKQQIEVELYKIRDRINNLYFGILLTQIQQKQNLEVQDILKRNMDVVATMIKNGVAMQCDYDAIKVELLNSEQNTETINSYQQSYIKMLSFFINKLIDKNEIERPKDGAIEGMMVNNRPEQNLYNAKSLLYSSQLNQVKASLMPRFGAFAQGYYGNLSYNMFENLFDNKWTFNFMIGAKVQWNLDGLYKKKNNTEKIKTQISQTEVERETFNFNNNIQSIQKEEEINRIKKEMTKDKEITQLRSAIRESSEVKFKNGTIVVNDLLNDISKENTAKLTEQLHKMLFLQTQYDLKYILNN